MKINKFILLPLLLGAQFSLAASYSDYAKVISVEKVYKNYIIEEPYKECYIKETTVRSSDGGATNEIIGGILGGLFGNALGKGDGKKALTIAGTILGASLAHDQELKNSGKRRIVSEEICEIKYQRRSERRLSYYLIEYHYEGRDFTYKTKNRPVDDIIKVKVSINPIIIVE